MKLLAWLLLAYATHAQYEPKKEDALDALTTPSEGEACGYGSCYPIKPGWLNVHLVPQTHSELGHGYNFQQHYTGEDPPFPKNTVNMKRILDAILTELWNNDQRRFTLSDTAYLFHWWKNRHPAVHRMMYELVRQGRLSIVGGGLGVSDEASTSYHAIIDQYTYSLRKLNDTFRACARPLVAWAADVYGHSREFTSLMAQMGFDALFINPISYDEEVARMRRRSLEFLWRGSDDLGPSTDMFTHNLFDGYWAPPGFCFSKLCSDPLLVTSSRLFSDIRDRVDKFIEGVLYRQAPNFETRNVMVIMGHRKAYADADVWFTNIEKLMTFTNWRATRQNLNISLFYSNPACYLAAVHDENPELETKQDDFFPYVHDKDSYTVGMYSSRPTFKYLIREAHVYLQMAKQLQVTANMGPYIRMFDEFNWVMGVVQDHSIASGVLRQRVKEYYTSKLDAAMSNATDFVSKAFTKLRSSPKHVLYYRCQFNISSCYGSRFIKYTIQVYNPLGWPVTMPVRLPVYPTNSKFLVYDNKGEEVKSATIKLPDTILRIKDRPKADHELVFIAANLPPVGFRSYYIEAQFFKAKIILQRGGEEVDYDETTMTSIWKNQQESRADRLKKYEVNVIGLDSYTRQKKMIPTDAHNVTNNGTDAPEILTTKLKDNAQDKLKKHEMKVLGSNTNLRQKKMIATDALNVSVHATDAPRMVTTKLKDNEQESTEDTLKKYEMKVLELNTNIRQRKMMAKDAQNVSIHATDAPQMVTTELKDNEQNTNSNKKKKYEMKVHGINTNIRQTKMIATDAHNISFNASDAPQEVLKDKVSNYLRDMLNVDEISEDLEHSSSAPIMLPMLKESTTESEVMLPMLRDFLQKSNVLHKIDFVDTEKELLSSNELVTPELVTEAEEDTTYATERDIKINFKKITPVDDMLGEEDIRVPFKRPMKAFKTQIKNQFDQKENPIRTTTESDMRVITPFTVSDSNVAVDTDIEVPINKGTAKPKSGEFWESESAPSRTESLAIVPVRTEPITSTIAESTTTESVLVVPVSKVHEQNTFVPDLNTKQDAEVKNEVTTKSVPPVPLVNVAPLEVRRTNILKTPVDGRNTEVLVDTDAIVDTGGRNEDIEQIEYAERFRAYVTPEEASTGAPETDIFRPYAETTEKLEQFKNEAISEQKATNDVESVIGITDYPAYVSSSTDNMFGTTGAYDDKLPVLPMGSRTGYFKIPESDKSEKYFKVDDGSKLFIGNKYVRVNLDKSRRIASIFLRNGVRIKLEIIMFHYVSDDPAKFDIRTVPRRDIKPPGAYIFRPIDPYIVRSDNNYDVSIVKTDIVEEMHMTFSNWTSLQLRLYVDSPVIELHWLVGPIPTDDGLGKDVFIRYQTDLQHDGAFYTDSNGRQTLKRIRGTRGTYAPVDLNPITGNLYPVTSKIYIEDLNKNIRFSVFNDRCQAGGALIDGAIDLMLHRRILTDDIGFGAFLNETENGEPIRAAGTHYLYLSKATRNKIFEKKFAKEISLAPRVLTSHHMMYSDDMRKQFLDSSNEFSALKDKLPLGIHLLSLERITTDELLVRLENYLELVDVTSDGVRYVPLRDLFKDIRIVWLKETTLAGNMYKDQWAPTQWRKKNKFYRRFNDYYGGGNDTFEEVIQPVADELGGRGIRVAPQQIRTFIVKFKHNKA